MEFEEFCERLAKCTDKWEERQFINGTQWTDPKIKAYLSTVIEACNYKPTIEECLSQLNSDRPEWTLLIAMADWRNKCIELENTLNKSLPKADGMRRQTIQAMLQLINSADPVYGELTVHEETKMDISELVNSDDQVMNLFALERLECLEVSRLLEYESFIERCLGSKNVQLASAALRVLVRTENEQNADIIGAYKREIEARMAPYPEPCKLTVSSVVEEEYTGSWIPVSVKAPAELSKTPKRSIFSGHVN